MNNAEKVQPLDWGSLLDELKQKEAIGSDSKLAATLGVSRGYVCSVRKERKGLSLKLAQAVFSRLGRTFDTENLERLFVPVKVQSYTRSLEVARLHVVKRSNGFCELCGMPAPIKDSNGLPYLEVHHLISFRDGGTNALDNLVALCPNCHRKMEVSAKEADREKLQKVVANYKNPRQVPAMDR